MAKKKDKLDLSAVKKICDGIRGEIAKVVVGNTKVIDDLLICLICKGHLLGNGAFLESCSVHSGFTSF